jgi:hypothetical protein
VEQKRKAKGESGGKRWCIRAVMQKNKESREARMIQGNFHKQTQRNIMRNATMRRESIDRN